MGGEAPGQDDRVRALQAVCAAAAAEQIRIVEKAQLDIYAFRPAIDADVAIRAIASATPQCIHKLEPDRDFPDKVALVLRLTACGTPVYCKLTLRLGEAPNVGLISFKRWNS